MIIRAVTQLNGISIAYVMALINSGFAVLLAFGAPLTDTEKSSVVGFLNAALVLLAHFSHRLGEANNTPSVISQQKMKEAVERNQA